MADPLSELKTDLALLAKPKATGSGTGPGKWTGSAEPEPILHGVEALLNALKGISALESAIQALGGAIETGFDDVAEALEAIAGQIVTLQGSPAEVGQALAGLQNALSTASSLVPGGANTAVLQSGGQIFEHLSKLLAGVPTFLTAAELLYEIAQQLKTIGKAVNASVE